MRAVLDTNVFLRLIFSAKPGGVAAALWSFFLEDSFTCLTSEPLMEELKEVFQHPALREVHAMDDGEVMVLIRQIRAHTEPVEDLPGVHSPGLAERDETDLLLLSTALAGEAQGIVSQDRDLLDLSRFRGIDILDPLAFLKRLRQGKVN